MGSKRNPSIAKCIQICKAEPRGVRAGTVRVGLMRVKVGSGWGRFTKLQIDCGFHITRINAK